MQNGLACGRHFPFFDHLVFQLPWLNIIDSLKQGNRGSSAINRQAPLAKHHGRVVFRALPCSGGLNAFKQKAKKVCRAIPGVPGSWQSKRPLLGWSSRFNPIGRNSNFDLNVSVFIYSGFIRSSSQRPPSGACCKAGRANN